MSWINKLVKPFRVEHGKDLRLKNFDPGDTGWFRSKEHAKDLLQSSIHRMADLQDKLYAQDCWSVLLIFQAMDAAGKDGAIKHVMSGVNPQGCQVYSFKALCPNVFGNERRRNLFVGQNFGVYPRNQHLLIIRPVKDSNAAALR